MPDAPELAADVPDPLAVRERSEDARRLLDCLGRLEPEQRQLVLLAYYDGLSREQLAARFKRPVNTIKTWLRRSLLAVRECLGS
jgi:RNA polymerase sigma-70 factor (ECF subfamily)